MGGFSIERVARTVGGWKCIAFAGSRQMANGAQKLRSLKQILMTTFLDLGFSSPTS